MGTGDTRAGVWLVRTTASCRCGHSNMALAAVKAMAPTPITWAKALGQRNLGVSFLARRAVPARTIPSTPSHAAELGLITRAIRAKRVRGSVATWAEVRT
jgi:hypothetical protein